MLSNEHMHSFTAVETELQKYIVNRKVYGKEGFLWFS